MTVDMMILFEKLHTVEVGNIAAAYDFITKEIEKLDMDDRLSFVFVRKDLKKINKDYKTLKKYFKGKLQIDPESVYQKYEENTQEHYFLMCLVRLMQHNKK